MIRPILSASLAALCLAAPAIAETRTYEVGEFSAIQVSAGLDATFETGSATRIAVDNSSGDFSDIIVEVQGDTLVLKRPKRRGLIGNWSRRKSYEINIVTPELSGLSVSSGAEVNGSGMSGPKVRIEVSSGANASVTGISADRVRLEASSGADLEASGTCDEVVADSSSGSDIDASDLVCDAAIADASSGSDMRVHATGRLNADASSGGDIDVYGQPAVTEIDKSSGGSVSLKG